jgi:nicotinate (nicotinamide) nucleotide adenylyltransferase
MKTVIYGGSFNPPGLHHLVLAEKLTKQFDRVIIVPCGFRSDKVSFDHVDIDLRKQMLEATFGAIPGVEIDYYDLDRPEFTRTRELDIIMKNKYGNELWHAVGTDLIQGGSRGQSEIHQAWHHGLELWQSLKFAVITRVDVPASPADFPQQTELVQVDVPGSSTEIRKRILAGKPISNMVVPAVELLITKNQLFQEAA